VPSKYFDVFRFFGAFVVTILVVIVRAFVVWIFVVQCPHIWGQPLMLKIVGVC
jgi:hypothetical protein